MKDKIDIIRELTGRLNEARKKYEQDNIEIMSNKEYDALYDKLQALEEETGVVMSDSPTANVGYELLSDLPRERHPSRMLSLDKTKEVDELISFLGDKRGLLSWKLDGLTIVLTYEDGKLAKAVTRGNGEIGEVITNNARTFRNIPLGIPFKGHLVIRGEAFITYSDFKKINEYLPETDAQYKNPRNLCSGSVRQLNNEITASRNVKLNVFSLVEADEVDFENSRKNQLEWLNDQGFETVQCRVVDSENLREAVEYFAEEIKTYDIPSDGLVLTFDDIAFGRSLGQTAKFPRDAIAFKWQDETAETVLQEIHWSASRTGLINPVAIFDPVELEGTTVTRASVHNISIMKELKLAIGDRIEVYKANMIIPQIAANLTGGDHLDIPVNCPVCGGRTEIRSENGVEVLFCTNPDCQAKHVKSFSHFVGREALNIEGLSEATIEKLIDSGIIRSFADLFRLENHKEEISSMEGFGEKSFNNLVAAAQKASETTPARLLYGLGVPGIGVANAKMICKYCNNDWNAVTGLSHEELTQIDGVGDIMAGAFTAFFEKDDNLAVIEELMKYISFAENTSAATASDLEGKTFVITGSLNHYENRAQLKEEIENRGGKVASSVSKNTDYLINNDIQSKSSKNKKALDLGVNIITEEQFINGGL